MIGDKRAQRAGHKRAEHDAISGSGQLPLQHALFYMAEVQCALAHMHDAGITTVSLSPTIEPRVISLVIRQGDQSLPAARSFVTAAIEAAKGILR